MSVRSPVTVMPVLGGVVAGTTVTASNVFAPGGRVEGLAEIVANSIVPPPVTQTGPGEDELRGTGAVTASKSALLLSVSVQPPVIGDRTAPCEETSGDPLLTEVPPSPLPAEPFPAAP